MKSGSSGKKQDKTASCVRKRNVTSDWDHKHELMHGRPVHQPLTYFPTSSITGAGHSKNVSSTIAGFSSVAGRRKA